MTDFRTRLLVAVLTLAALAVRVAVCEGAPNTEAWKAVCRIHNGSSAGSGTLVGRDDNSGLVVTCYHLFTEGDFGPVCSFTNGQRLVGKLVASDPTNDLAAIWISRPDVEPVPLADYRPEKGERIYSAGYGSTATNQLAVNEGIVDRHVDRGNNGDYEGVRITGTVRSGDSGGCFLNESGELAAVLWGGNEVGVYGTSSAFVNVMLKQCHGGVCRPYYRPVPMEPLQPRPPQVTQPKPTPSPPVQPSRPCNCDPGGGCKCGNVNSCTCSPDSRCSCDKKQVAALQVQIDALSLRIKQLEARPQYQPDYDKIAKEVQGRLPPIRVRQIDKNGQVAVNQYGEREEMNVWLGQNLNLRYTNVDNAQLEALEDRVKDLETD